MFLITSQKFIIHRVKQCQARACTPTGTSSSPLTWPLSSTVGVSKILSWTNRRVMRGFFSALRKLHDALPPSCMWSIRSTETSSPCTLAAKCHQRSESERLLWNHQVFSCSLLRAYPAYRCRDSTDMDQGGDRMVHGRNHLPRRQLPQFRSSKSATTPLTYEPIPLSHQ